MKQENKGEIILKHYSKFLGEFSAVKSFAGEKQGFPIQFLMYENIFSGCKTFMTLGVSKFHDSIHNQCELMFSVDKDEDDATSIMANAVFHLINNKIPLDRGTFVSGINNINPDFMREHNKSAVYFSDVFCMPQGFPKITEKLNILLCFFITSEELSYLKQYGYEQFENYLEKKDCDVFNIDRY